MSISKNLGKIAAHGHGSNCDKKEMKSRKSLALDRFIPHNTSNHAYKVLKTSPEQPNKAIERSIDPERFRSTTPAFFSTFGNSDQFNDFNDSDDIMITSTPRRQETQYHNSGDTNDVNTNNSNNNNNNNNYINNDNNNNNNGNDNNNDISNNNINTNTNVNYDTGSDDLIHKKFIEISLGLNSPNRILNFNHNARFVQVNTPISQYNQTSNEFPVTSSQQIGKYNRPKKRLKSHIPFRVLDAPSLRNDFYSNLISWSGKTGNILVGLGSAVYIWSETQGAIPILKIENSNDFITCVSFSPNNLYFIIGTKFGYLLLFSQINLTDNITPLCKIKLNSFKGITCTEWFHLHDSIENQNFFISGEETGEISLFKIIETSNNTELHCIGKIQAQKQQVCGISINYDNTMVAVGGNDNSCSLWDIKSFNNAKLKFLLNHNAAVKAVAFCPWSKSLLATGGGSKDKTIKFWHTKTGTLINKIKTTGQVTSLIWSSRYKQIVATFGFGDIEKPLLLILYSYPKLTQLLYVKTPQPLRALSAVLSPDFTSICVATNDETLRFFRLWEDNEDVIIQSQMEGLYGSRLIEFMEGIHHLDKKQNLR
ncbi:hypothetical protein KAFR_0B04210 [Kazachstania africana CBS 2517]|uniref:CDC20/Fizzy WD40 domain-containing protein n=1 Tax=Kazachstania africana (strain ATCC 22294 / BCRC 22015 / CBS 2517 / CECT 1963 / NBRC 1671 / NRRL Y-8276) TaxID=1071382 RepID=H2AQR7_KAZAF|nr:hypothetical protein KAFR_0B04210 [Kazachstania africana CBS 2517]CCF56717.1 hypothetical protein KAFR_0B04210 [Kazachstania africana CBS 2517]